MSGRTYDRHDHDGDRLTVNRSFDPDGDAALVQISLPGGLTVDGSLCAAHAVPKDEAPALALALMEGAGWTGDPTTGEPLDGAAVLASLRSLTRYLGAWKEELGQ